MESGSLDRIERYILKHVAESPFERLPKDVKDILGNSKDKWKVKNGFLGKENVVLNSIRYQLRWRTNLVRHMFHNEKLYYEQLIKSSLDRQLVSFSE